MGRKSFYLEKPQYGITTQTKKKAKKKKVKKEAPDIDEESDKSDSSYKQTQTMIDEIQKLRMRTIDQSSDSESDDTFSQQDVT